MLKPKTFTTAQPLGEAVTRHLQDNVVETVYSGHLSKELLALGRSCAAGARRGPQALLAGGPHGVHRVRHEHARARTTHLQALPRGQRSWLRLRLKHAVASSLIARTFIKTVSLSSRVGIHICDRREDALLYLTALGGRH